MKSVPVIYQSKEVVNCPHCGKPSDDIAEDFVVHGPFAKPGHAYKTDCGWCDEEFTVKLLPNGTYEVKSV